MSNATLQLLPHIVFWDKNLLQASDVMENAVLLSRRNTSHNTLYEWQVL